MPTPSRSPAAAEPLSHRDRLRAATAELHARVDARLSGAFERDRAAYGMFLTSLAEGLLPLEDALEAAGVDALLADWPQRRRGPDLRDDLADLGLAVPGPRRSGRFDGEARLLGALYVLEGSRLGSRLLLRRALANDDPVVRRATRYLARGEARDLWPAFLARLEASPAVAAAPADAVAGARDAFASFLPAPEREEATSPA